MPVTATTTANTGRQSTVGFYAPQQSLFHEYDFGFDVNAQCSASLAADSLFPLDTFTAPVQQVPFQNSPDWYLPQTDSFEFLTWNDPSIGEDLSLDSSFPIAAGASIGNDNFPGQSDVGSIDNMSQSHSFLDNQIHRAISTDQSSPTSSNPKSTSSPTHSSPPSPPSPKTQTPTSSSSTVSRVEKRKLNTLAARRYRQKRVDQMSSLEAALKEVERERDALKVRVAKLEGETDILKSLLSKKN
ncbi:uncharacterized protein EAE97_009886 [Botrytis byssoidea]|uniref:BZIP domain-containing protein n=1 Tax=Botrytis byssoidea TaxID=139641 RepID=A0A9P5IAC1_9HELO|nr:uncharacterized protein EAE97_009886 [Botrytis byssoidea]KAF7928088.1 hypothetical protein EAE97_009886 [Botrytis byssoidea]